MRSKLPIFPLIFEEVKSAAESAIDIFESELLRMQTQKNSVSGFFVGDEHGELTARGHLMQTGRQLAFLAKNEIHTVFCEFFKLEPGVPSNPQDKSWRAIKIWKCFFNERDYTFRKRLEFIRELAVLDDWLLSSIRSGVTSFFIQRPTDFCPEESTKRIQTVANVLLWLAYLSCEEVTCFGIDCFVNAIEENRLALTNPVWAEWVCKNWDGKSKWAMIAGKSHWIDEKNNSNPASLNILMPHRLKAYGLPSGVINI